MIIGKLKNEGTIKPKLKIDVDMEPSLWLKIFGECLSSTEFNDLI